MKRYDIEVVVGTKSNKAQLTYKVNVTANGPTSARKQVLERAWGTGLYVVRFNYCRPRNLRGGKK